MRKAIFTGMLALAVLGPLPAFAEMAASGHTLQASPRLESGISRFKSALRLKPDQERHWPRVEAALRSIAHESDEQQSRPGFFRRVGNRAAELALSAASMRRLVSAAQPLVKSLDETQKREALTLARAMGFGSLAARFE